MKLHPPWPVTNLQQGVRWVGDSVTESITTSRQPSHTNSPHCDSAPRLHRRSEAQFMETPACSRSGDTCGNVLEFRWLRRHAWRRRSSSLTPDTSKAASHSLQAPVLVPILVYKRDQAPVAVGDRPRPLSLLQLLSPPWHLVGSTPRFHCVDSTIKW